MDLFREVTEADRLRLLTVVEKAIALARHLGTPGWKEADAAWVVGMVLSGAIQGMWVKDHTLVLYRLSTYTWFSPTFHSMLELLVFRYAADSKPTFRTTLNAMLEVAKRNNLNVLIVGNTLTPYPDRIRDLYLRHGFVRRGDQLVKEL